MTGDGGPWVVCLKKGENSNYFNDLLNACRRLNNSLHSLFISNNVADSIEYFLLSIILKHAITSVNDLIEYIINCFC